MYGALKSGEMLDVHVFSQIGQKLIGRLLAIISRISDRNMENSLKRRPQGEAV